MKNLYFAQGYGCEQYGETIAYNSCVSVNGSASTSSGLANTGVGIMAIVVIAAILIFLGLLIRFLRRKPKQTGSSASKKDKLTVQ